jgi:hypothetical protein
MVVVHDETCGTDELSRQGYWQIHTSKSYVVQGLCGQFPISNLCGQFVTKVSVQQGRRFVYNRHRSLARIKETLFIMQISRAQQGNNEQRGDQYCCQEETQSRARHHKNSLIL